MKGTSWDGSPSAASLAFLLFVFWAYGELNGVLLVGESSLLHDFLDHGFDDFLDSLASFGTGLTEFHLDEG